MESNQQHSPPRPTGCWRWYIRPRRNKVIPFETEEERIQQREKDSKMEKRERKLEEGRRQQECEIHNKKMRDLKIKHQQLKIDLQRCKEKDEALKRELKEKTEMLSRRRTDYKEARERETELRRRLQMMKERIEQQEEKREDERGHLDYIDFLHVFNVLTVQKCREQMSMQMQTEETLHHTVDKRANMDGNEEATDQKQDEPQEQERLNGGALSPEQPTPSTSSLAEPTTPFSVRDSVEKEKPGSQIQSFQEPEAEEQASETQKHTDEKCEKSPRPEPSAFKCFSRFRFPKIRIPKLRSTMKMLNAAGVTHLFIILVLTVHTTLGIEPHLEELRVGDDEHFPVSNSKVPDLSTNAELH
ncbi:hypothetical protein AOLI_G00323760 [Acnodon oligacanthus]